MAPEELTTARLHGVRLDASFTDDLVRMWEDERVTATLGGRRSPDQVAAMVRAYEGQWAANGFGEWAWHDRTTGAFVGRAGLRRVTIDGREKSLNAGKVGQRAQRPDDLHQDASGPGIGRGLSVSRLRSHALTWSCETTRPAFASARPSRVAW